MIQNFRIARMNIISWRRPHPASSVAILSHHSGSSGLWTVDQWNKQDRACCILHLRLHYLIMPHIGSRCCCRRYLRNTRWRREAIRRGLWIRCKMKKAGKASAWISIRYLSCKLVDPRNVGESKKHPVSGAIRCLLLHSNATQKSNITRRD